MLLIAVGLSAQIVLFQLAHGTPLLSSTKSELIRVQLGAVPSVLFESDSLDFCSP